MDSAQHNIHSLYMESFLVDDVNEGIWSGCQNTAHYFSKPFWQILPLQGQKNCWVLLCYRFIVTHSESLLIKSVLNLIILPSSVSKYLYIYIYIYIYIYTALSLVSVTDLNPFQWHCNLNSKHTMESINGFHRFKSVCIYF